MNAALSLGVQSQNAIRDDCSVYQRIRPRGTIGGVLPATPRYTDVQRLRKKTLTTTQQYLTAVPTSVSTTTFARKIMINGQPYLPSERLRLTSMCDASLGDVAAAQQFIERLPLIVNQAVQKHHHPIATDIWFTADLGFATDHDRTTALPSIRQAVSRLQKGHVNQIASRTYVRSAGRSLLDNVIPRLLLNSPGRHQVPHDSHLLADAVFWADAASGKSTITVSVICPSLYPATGFSPLEDVVSGRGKEGTLFRQRETHEMMDELDLIGSNGGVTFTVDCRTGGSQYFTVFVRVVAFSGDNAMAYALLSTSGGRSIHRSNVDQSHADFFAVILYHMRPGVVTLGYFYDHLLSLTKKKEGALQIYQERKDNCLEQRSEGAQLTALIQKLANTHKMMSGNGALMRDNTRDIVWVGGVFHLLVNTLMVIMEMMTCNASERMQTRITHHIKCATDINAEGKATASGAKLRRLAAELAIPMLNAARESQSARMRSFAPLLLLASRLTACIYQDKVSNEQVEEIRTVLELRVLGALVWMLMGGLSAHLGGTGPGTGPRGLKWHSQSQHQHALPLVADLSKRLRSRDNPILINQCFEEQGENTFVFHSMFSGLLRNKYDVRGEAAMWQNHRIRQAIVPDRTKRSGHRAFPRHPDFDVVTCHCLFTEEHQPRLRNKPEKKKKKTQRKKHQKQKSPSSSSSSLSASSPSSSSPSSLSAAPPSFYSSSSSPAPGPGALSSSPSSASSSSPHTSSGSAPATSSPPPSSSSSSSVPSSSAPASSSPSSDPYPESASGWSFVPNGRLPIYSFNWRRFLFWLPLLEGSLAFLLRSGQILWAVGKKPSPLRAAVLAQREGTDGEQPRTFDTETLVVICVCGTCTNAPKAGIHRDFRLDKVLPAVRRMRFVRQSKWLRKWAKGGAKKVNQKHISQYEARIATITSGDNTKYTRSDLEAVHQAYSRFLETANLPPPPPIARCAGADPLAHQCKSADCWIRRKEGPPRADAGFCSRRCKTCTGCVCSRAARGCSDECGCGEGCTRKAA